MNWVHTAIILLAAWLIVYCQSAFNFVRQLVGTQINLLPALMVYTSLNAGFTSVTLLGVMGGLLFDALSANPLGVSVLPLFLPGFLLHQKRELLCREEILVHWVLGFGASLFVPLGSLVLLYGVGESPLLGWLSLWQ